jgi:sodium-dependent phosphate transporter
MLFDQYFVRFFVRCHAFHILILLPPLISGTHSIVGGILGFSLVQHGFNGIHFHKLLKIVLSWFVSPVLAGVVAVLWFFWVKYFIILAPFQVSLFPDIFGQDSLSAGLVFLPIFYAITVFCNVLSISLSAPPLLR